MLALGAALTIVGTLIGRRVAGPTKSGTHLFVVALAGTGAGKQHAIDCIKSALIAARAKSNIGPGDIYFVAGGREACDEATSVLVRHG